MVTVDEVDSLKQFSDPGPGVSSVQRVFHVRGDMTKSSPELAFAIPRAGDVLVGNPRYKVVKPPVAVKETDEDGHVYWTVTVTYSLE